MDKFTLTLRVPQSLPPNYTQIIKIIKIKFLHHDFRFVTVGHQIPVEYFFIDPGETGVLNGVVGANE